MGRPLKRILYVEDEPDIQAIAKLTLENIGQYDVKLCSSGNEALASIKGFEPDLVLLDVMMPEMDGPTTLKELRKLPEGKNLPIIFMTAKVQPSEVEHYKDLGAIGVIAKPFDPMTLSNTVNQLWQENQPA
ncbi:MAG: response regulator [Gammaproteobacteria bacterium]|nr:MAG: response regulator [Gammaproteobacteria bacterium]